MPGRKAFKAFDGRYIMSEEGELFTHHYLNEHGGKGYFHIEGHGDNKVSLRTHHGKYVAAGQYHDIYLSHQHHEYETKFHIEFSQNGQVCFRSHHSGYIGVDPSGTVRIHNALTPGEWFWIHSE